MNNKIETNHRETEREIYQRLAAERVGRLRISLDGLPFSAYRHYKERGVPVTIETEGGKKTALVHIAYTDPIIKDDLALDRKKLEEDMATKHWAAVQFILDTIRTNPKEPEQLRESQWLLDAVTTRKDIAREIKLLQGKVPDNRLTSLEYGFPGGPFMRFDGILDNSGRMHLPDRTGQCTGWGRALPRVAAIENLTENAEAHNHFNLLAQRATQALTDQSWNGEQLLFIGKGGGEYTSWETEALSTSLGADIYKLPMKYYGWREDTQVLDERFCLEWLILNEKIRVTDREVEIDLPDYKTIKTGGILFGSGMEHVGDQRVHKFLRKLLTESNVPLLGHPFFSILYESKALDAINSHAPAHDEDYLLDYNSAIVAYGKGSLTNVYRNETIHRVDCKDSAMVNLLRHHVPFVVKGVDGWGAQNMAIVRSRGDLERRLQNQHGAVGIIQALIDPENQKRLTIYNPGSDDEETAHARYELYFVPNKDRSVTLPNYITFTARPGNDDFKVHGATDSVFGSIHIT